VLLYSFLARVAPDQALALTLFLGPALLGDAVILVLAPHAVVHNVLFYRSQPGSYGITGIARAIGVALIGNAYSRVLLSARPARIRGRGGGRPLATRPGHAPHAAARGVDPVRRPGRRLRLRAAVRVLVAAAPRRHPLFDRGWRLLLLAFYVIRRGRSPLPR
jgi:hypothetical protein